MIYDGLIVTVVGMGTVFVFLVLLVCVVSLTTKLLGFVNKFMPEIVEQPVAVASKTSVSDEDVAVAIAVAKLNM